jgi:hypothetical protein
MFLEENALDGSLGRALGGSSQSFGERFVIAMARTLFRAG